MSINITFTITIISSSTTITCREVSSLNDSLKCHFILTNPDCQIDGGYFDYLRAIFCLFPQNLLPLVVTLYVSLCPWVPNSTPFPNPIHTGAPKSRVEGGFCPNLSAISTTLKLSHNVAVSFSEMGAEEDALERETGVGNKGETLVVERSAIIAFSNSRTASLAIGALFGAGVLVTTVVAGGIAIIRPFTAASRPFFRDIIFYMVSVFLTFTVLYRGRINLAWSLGYLGFYIFYVSTVLLCTWIYKRLSVAPGTHSLLDFPELQVDSEDGNSSVFNSYDYGEEYRSPLYYEETTLHIFIRALNPLDYHKWKRKPWHWKLLKIFKMPVEFVLLLTVPTVDLDKNDQNWKRPLNCLHLFTGPLFCVLTLHSGVYGFYEIKGLFPIWGIIVLLGTLFASITFFATSNDQPPRFHQVRRPSFPQGCFRVSDRWRAAFGVPRHSLCRPLGVRGEPENTQVGSLLGQPLVACGFYRGEAGAEAPVAARPGLPRVTREGCVPADMLIGVGLGSVLEISRNHMEMKLESNELLTWILAGALGLSLLFTFISVPVQCFQLSRVYGFCLIFFYLNFLVVALLTEFGVIHL
uniref:Solute carrier family 8 member B1 n=1 Tax=Monodelphis domestica TaxID=13616 RepID=F7C8J7_MONDO